MFMDFSLMDVFCRLVLMTTKEFVFILLILIGFVFLRKEAFGRAFFIFAFSMILNPFLKSLFQVPPAPAANPEGWAFPSGHMQIAATFWIWLAWEYKNKFLYVFTALLLACIGFALVYCDYHYPVDIAGAVFFAILTLVLYGFAIKNKYIQQNPYMIGFFLAALAMPIMFFTPKVTKLLFIWVAFAALIGFATGWFINDRFCSRSSSMSLKIKIFIFILSIIGLVGIEFLFGLIQTRSLLTQTIHFFIVALWLSSIPQCIACVLFKDNQLGKKLKGKRA